jgi:folate-dependent phosphoribosylglycinamide formyltransferase PurN
MSSRNKSFAIYCSGGASRVIKFYSRSANLESLPPEIVVYDGDQPDVIAALSKLFGSRLIQFAGHHPQFDPDRPNHSTSTFIERALDEHAIDYLLCFGTRLFKGSLIQKYARRLINFHPSLLPAYKGLMPIDRALTDKTPILGNTAHYMIDAIDGGEIIVQAAMLAEDFDSYEDVLELQFPMMKLILRDLLHYDIAPEAITADLSHRSKPYLIPAQCVA